MNRVDLIGRLVKDPDVRYAEKTTIARYTLAVDRPTKDKTVDFISCTTFGKNAEFAEKYLKKGMKIAISGRIQTGNYKNKDGNTVYTTEVIAEIHEFCEGKTANSGNENHEKPNSEQKKAEKSADNFMDIPENADEIGFPFS